MSTVTIRRIRELIEHDVVSYGGASALARKLKVSRAHLSDIRHERRNPGPKVLRHYGLAARREVVITYTPLLPGAAQ